MWTSFSRSPSLQVARPGCRSSALTTSAMSSSVTSSRSNLCAAAAASCAARRCSASFCSQLGDAAVLDLARASPARRGAAPAPARSAAARAPPCSLRCSSMTAFSLLPLALSARRTSPSARRVLSRCVRAAPCSRHPFPSSSACRSISSCMISRSITSISVGIESSSIFNRDAASSTRSTALSGRKRSLM